jgi:hypothetical protein
MKKLFKITGFVSLFAALILAVSYALGLVSTGAVSFVLFFEVVGVLCYSSSLGDKHGNSKN